MISGVEFAVIIAAAVCWFAAGVGLGIKIGKEMYSREKK
jgi:hypothetical protein